MTVVEKIQVYLDSTGIWRWRALHVDGETAAYSRAEGFTDEADARYDAEALFPDVEVEVAPPEPEPQARPGDEAE